MADSTASSVLLHGFHGNQSSYVFHSEVTMTTMSPDNSSHGNETHEKQDYACYSITTYMDNEYVLTSHQIYLYASLTFVVIGLIGNALSVMVFSSKPMRNISSNFYLLMLAISDSFYLISVFLAKILTTLRCFHFKEYPLDVFNRSDFMCRLLQYMLDLFSDYSSCLILAFTMERVIAVYLPLKFKEICTLRRAKIACLMLLFVIMLTTGKLILTISNLIPLFNKYYFASYQTSFFKEILQNFQFDSKLDCVLLLNVTVLIRCAIVNVNKTNAQAIPPQRYGLQLHLHSVCRISAI